MVGWQEQNSPSHTTVLAPRSRGVWARDGGRLVLPQAPHGPAQAPSHPSCPTPPFSLFPDLLCQTPHWRASIGRPWSQVFCSVTITCQVLLLLGTLRRGTGCPQGESYSLSSAVSPGPSPATQPVRWAGFDIAWPGFSSTSRPSLSPRDLPASSALGYPPPLPLGHPPALLPPIPHTCVCSAAAGPALQLRSTLPTAKVSGPASLGTWAQHRPQLRGTDLLAIPGLALLPTTTPF